MQFKNRIINNYEQSKIIKEQYYGLATVYRSLYIIIVHNYLLV